MLLVLLSLRLLQLSLQWHINLRLLRLELLGRHRLNRC